jgi:hypothetical protein
MSEISDEYDWIWWISVLGDDARIDKPRQSSSERIVAFDKYMNSTYSIGANLHSTDILYHNAKSD